MSDDLDPVPSTTPDPITWYERPLAPPVDLNTLIEGLIPAGIVTRSQSMGEG